MNAKAFGIPAKGTGLHALGHNNFIGNMESDRLAYAGGFTLCMLEGTT